MASNISSRWQYPHQRSSIIPIHPNYPNPDPLPDRLAHFIIRPFAPKWISSKQTAPAFPGNAHPRRTRFMVRFKPFADPAFVDRLYFHTQSLSVHFSSALYLPYLFQFMIDKRHDLLYRSGVLYQVPNWATVYRNSRLASRIYRDDREYVS